MGPPARFDVRRHHSDQPQCAVTAARLQQAMQASQRPLKSVAIAHTAKTEPDTGRGIRCDRRAIRRGKRHTGAQRLSGRRARSAWVLPPGNHGYAPPPGSSPVVARRLPTLQAAAKARMTITVTQPSVHSPIWEKKC